MACLHWSPEPATVATIRLYIPSFNPGSFMFEHYSLISEPEDGLFSSSACLVQSSDSSHLPQHNLLEQVLSRLGCFFLLTSLHRHPKRSNNIEIVLLDGSHSTL